MLHSLNFYPRLSKLLLYFSAIFSAFSIQAQELIIRPISPKITDTVTITYDATKGNGALADCNEKLYFHAGLITDRSLDERDWKFVVGNWGTADKAVEMKKAGDNLYVTSFVPKTFFKISEDINVRQMAFVFRNEDGSKVGKTKDETDIYAPMFGYVEAAKSKNNYLFDELIFKKIEQKDSYLRILTEQGDIVLRPFSDSIIETSWHPDGFSDFQISHAVAAQPKKVNAFVAETEHQLIYDLPGLQVLVQKQPFKISYLNNGKPILEEEKGFFSSSDASGIRFRMQPEERFYGSGSRASGLDLRGHHLELYNRPDYGYEFGANNLNYTIPLLISSNKYSLLVDNPQKAWFDIGAKTHDILEFGTLSGPLHYYIITSDEYPALIEQYSWLTGKQPMLPRWAFGNLQSRMAYRTQEETTEIVEQMIREDFPIDAVIIDFYWFGDSILGHLGRFDWWQQSWPNPEEMIASFKSKGVRTITISEPYIIDSLKNWKIADSLGILATNKMGKSYIDKQFYFGNGSLIDIYKPEASQWLWKQYRKQFDIGVEGLWGDLGEPESHPADLMHIWGSANEVHNIYGHYWAKSIFDNFRKDFPERRLFFLARSGFAGTQRYGIVPWSGDVSRSWGGLQAQLPSMLNMSLSGIAYMHSDAGGFALGTKDEELYTRWLQFAVFTPILRPHGSDIPSEPIFFNDTTKRIVRHFMKLRYELLPYIYTAAWENSTKATPIVSPLFIYHPEEERLSSYFSTYYFGRNLLIAPVTEPKQSRMDIELPQGMWYHFWTGHKIMGGNKVQVQTALESIPIFVKSGSIIPRIKPIGNTSEYSSQHLDLHIYMPNYDSEFSEHMYEDNGELFGSYEKGAYELLHFKGKTNHGQFSLELSKEGEGYPGMPESRMIECVLYGLERNIRQVKLDGTELEELVDDAQKHRQGYWKDSNNKWHIRFVWFGQAQQLEIR